MTEDGDGLWDVALDAARGLTGRRTPARVRDALVPAFEAAGLAPEAARLAAASLSADRVARLLAQVAEERLAGRIRLRRRAADRPPRPPDPGGYAVAEREALVAGDEIAFEEHVWIGRWARGVRRSGARRIEARVLRDGFGRDRQQHTFTLRVVAASGTEAPRPGEELMRKARTLFEAGVRRRPWPDEEARRALVAEQAERAAEARRERRARLAREFGPPEGG
jgi:hypothetical protein